ncbi:MAG TPA: DUF3892 domain-containing protein [Pyrinomonadaceae bacterium]|nr:DUF3892 domain-containing protein [Pyrinomonadaceae bacterium]
MERYRIVCTEQEPVTEPTTHAHIVRVGTGTDTEKADKRWSLNEVLAAIDKGDSFYTQGKETGKVAEVEKYICAKCRRTWVRSTPDSVKDNNLDSLRRCNWS